MLKQIILVSLALQAIYANTFLGKVIDAKTGMPIIEANIQVNDSEQTGTTTNKSGIFSLPVTNLKNINIKITAIGYTTAEKSFEIENSDMATIRLNQSAVELSPIDVIADRSLLIAYTMNTKKIIPKIVRPAVKDVGGLNPLSTWVDTMWKSVLPGFLALGILFFGIDYYMLPDFNSDKEAGKDINLMIKENPIIPDNISKLQPKSLILDLPRAKLPKLETVQKLISKIYYYSLASSFSLSPSIFG